MIDLYIGLRVNQFAIICGPEIDGKSTIWKVIEKAIISTMSASNNPVIIMNSNNLFFLFICINLVLNYFKNQNKGKWKQRSSQKIFSVGKLSK